MGIRNALIANFNGFDIRNDVGVMWENFLISERVKKNNNTGISASSYFWRTIAGREIDYIEEVENILSAYEIKWSGHNSSIPKTFADNYKDAAYSVVSKDNYLDFLL